MNLNGVVLNISIGAVQAKVWRSRDLPPPTWSNTTRVTNRKFKSNLENQKFYKIE